MYKVYQDHKLKKTFTYFEDAFRYIMNQKPKYSTYYIDQLLDNKQDKTLFGIDSNNMYMHKDCLVETTDGGYRFNFKRS